jgi:hypothetical protein
MDTKQSDFVAKRLQAHTAGTIGLERDPLVKAALDARKPTEPVHPQDRELFVFAPGWNTRRQAG